MMIVLGSRAARHHLPTFRDPADWDLVVTSDEIRRIGLEFDGTISEFVPASPYKYRLKLHDEPLIEVEVAEEGSNVLLVAAARGWPSIETPIGRAFVPPLDTLWRIKKAHVYWPVHWEKNIADLHVLGAACGFRPDAAAEAFYRLRLAECEAKYGARRQARLSMSNDAFFAKSQKAVGRVVDHDQIHEVVAYGERPLFETMKHDPSLATLARDLFEAADRQTQLRLVREEAMAIAIERYIVPGTVTDGAQAYAKALKRICTTLTSGWFREFAIMNWPALNEPDFDFVTRFWCSPLGISLRSPFSPSDHPAPCSP